MKYATLVTVLLVLAYVGLYVAVLALPSSSPVVYVDVGALVELRGPWYVNGERIADYHGIPKAFFAPIQTIDKRWIRHSYWHLSNQD